MKRKAKHDRRLAKVVVQRSADSFVVNQTFVLRINIMSSIVSRRGRCDET